MGLSTGTLVKSPKKTETTTSMPNKIELNELQEEIKILKRNISLMLEENLKLNQTNVVLRNKIITISTNLSHQNNSKIQNDVINIPGDLDRGYSNHLTSSIESKAQKRGEHPFLLRFIKVLIRKFNLNSKDNEQLPWKFDNEYSKKDRVVRYIATVRLREKDVFLIQTLSQKSKDDISNNLYDLDQILSNLFVEVRPESTEEMEAAL